MRPNNRATATGQSKAKADQQTTADSVSYTIWLEMNSIVAWLANCDSIVYVDPQFWMFGVMVDVVGIQISAPGVIAKLTGKSIPLVNIEPPLLVFFGLAESHSFSMLAILVSWAILSFRHYRPQGCAHFRTRFWAMLFAFTIVLAGVVSTPKGGPHF